MDITQQGPAASHDKAHLTTKPEDRRLDDLTSCQRGPTPGVVSIARISFGQGPRRLEVPLTMPLEYLQGQWRRWQL